MKAKKTEESVIEITDGDRMKNVTTARSLNQLIQSLMCKKQTYMKSRCSSVMTKIMNCEHFNQKAITATEQSGLKCSSCMQKMNLVDINVTEGQQSNNYPTKLCTQSLLVV